MWKLPLLQKQTQKSNRHRESQRQKDMTMTRHFYTSHAALGTSKWSSLERQKTKRLGPKGLGRNDSGGQADMEKRPPGRFSGVNDRKIRESREHPAVKSMSLVTVSPPGRPTWCVHMQNKDSKSNQNQKVILNLDPILWMWIEIGLQRNLKNKQRRPEVGQFCGQIVTAWNPYGAILSLRIKH